MASRSYAVEGVRTEQVARRAAGARQQPAPADALLRLQSGAGNQAVGALLAGRLRGPGEQGRSDIDAALVAVRQSVEPDPTVVERGLRAAKAVGVPVDIDGAAAKPPASALAVSTTGFGSDRVPAKRPVAGPKPIPKRPPPPATATGRRTQPPGSSGAREPGPVAPAPAAVAGPADLRLQPPVRPTPIHPSADPAHAAVRGRIAGVGRNLRSHPPAASKAAEAQSAAVAPTHDLDGQAKAAKVERMDAQRPGSFDKRAFIEAVQKAVEAKSPKTLKEADDFTGSGKAGEVKNEVKGMVATGTADQSRDITTATAAPPDTSAAVPKPVTPMGPEVAPGPQPVSAAGAAPKPAPAEQTNLAAGPHQMSREMAEGGITDRQLANSNEPEFQQALADKNTAAAHAATAPAQYRAGEAAAIAAHRADAHAVTSAGIAGMASSKGAALSRLVAAKARTKTADEVKRAEVTGRIQAIYTAAETDVRAILARIDPEVDRSFEVGEQAARRAFETFVAQKMRAYKADRYSGWLGGYRWLRDKLRGMPSKVNEFYTAGRELYLKQMTGVISRIADIVGGALNSAKARIAIGKAQIAGYVRSLPNDLRRIGTSASKEIGERFAELEGEVDEKQQAVVDTLASKYVEARGALDERIEQLQEENKGLIDKAIGAIKKIINTIRELVAMLTGVLARAAAVIGDIIADPVGFLGNFVGAIKDGIGRFVTNIAEHLRKGLTSWLFGQLQEGGVELPDSFDIRGIVKMLASMFGLTWNFIRQRIARRIGEKAMAAVEGGVEIFRKLAAGGIGALWEMLVDKLGDLKQMIMDKIQDFIVTKVITAGVTWLISLLNPAAAFIKACKLIYDVVMWFVENAQRIKEFVETVLDSVTDVVRGNLGAVAEKVENALGQVVPMLIGLLANVLGLGGIGEKVRSIIAALRKPVTKAVDFLVTQGMRLAGPIIRGVANVGKKAKAKVSAAVATGKDWAKRKIVAGKEGLLRLLRRPFTADGKDHTLTVNPAGKILIASNGGLTMDVQNRGAQAAARASGRTDLLPTLAELNVLRLRHEAHFAAVRDSEVNDLDSRDPRNRTFLAAIDSVVDMVRGIWTAVGYSGHPDETHPVAPSGLGNVASHARQITPRPNLESEHVLPRRWLSNVFEHVAGLQPLSQRQYEQMTTILIHEGAAKLKTYGAEGDNIGLRNLLTGAEGIGNVGPAIVTRVDLTMTAIKADHRAQQRPGEPQPTRAAVSRAAAIQAGEVVRFARENSGAAVGRGADHEGSRALIARATALISDGGSLPKFASLLSKLTGRFSGWLADHSGSAPAPTRIQMSAVHARLVAEAERRNRENPLTEQQSGVLRLLGEGLTTGEISSRLSISGSAVGRRVRELFLRFGVNSRQLVVSAARDRGLL